MPIYTLPSKPAIVAALAAGNAAAVSDRVVDLATRNGYVLGPGMVAVLADGRVVVDADRDPSADWAAFNPDAPTSAQNADAQALAKAREFRDKVKSGVSLTAAETRQLQGWLLDKAIVSMGG